MNSDDLLAVFYKYVIPVFTGIVAIAVVLLLVGHNYIQAAWFTIMIVINIAAYKRGMKEFAKENDLLKIPEKVKA